MFARRPRNGFTLIELMIVIAIIAIIAAIAVPSVMAAIRNANEKNAAVSLSQCRNAEMMFRSYGGIGTFYYTRDLAGLYWGKPPLAAIRADLIIDETMAKADDSPAANGQNFDWDADGNIDWTIAGTPPGVPIPKSSYFMGSLTTDEAGAAYKIMGSPLGANPGKFGFYARPAQYPSNGKYIFHTNETGQVYQKDAGSNAIIPQYQSGGGWSPVQ